MKKEEPDISFTSIGEARVLARYRLRFNTQADFKEILRRSEKDGCIFFNNGGKKNLVGRIVRIADEYLVIEVDAAEDIEEMA